MRLLTRMEPAGRAALRWSRTLFAAFLTWIWAGAAVAQTGWYAEPDGFVETYPNGDGYAAAWQDGRMFVVFSCAPSKQGLGVLVGFYQVPPFDPATETVFLRVAGVDYRLPWNPTVIAENMAEGFLQFVVVDPLLLTRWQGQEALIDALASGQPVEVLKARTGDMTNFVRLGITPAGAPGALSALPGLCGSQAAVYAPPPSETGATGWIVVQETPLWVAPTAQGPGWGNRAMLMLTCAADGRVVMAARAQGYPAQEGEQVSLPARVDDRQFQILWTGWKTHVFTYPEPALVEALRSGRTVVFSAGDGVPIDFALAGAAPVIDSALAPCR